LNGALFRDNTAGWSTFNADGTPKLDSQKLWIPENNVNGPFFPTPSNLCSGGDNCGSDGAYPRYAIWPDTAPLPVTLPDGSYRLYTWIREVHYPDGTLNADNGPYFPITLYVHEWDKSLGADALPKSVAYHESFFPLGSVSWGEYGWLKGIDGYAYLYGEAATGIMAARVPLGSIENRAAYQFWDGAAWSATPPAPGNVLANIPNAGAIHQQGSFYYSSYYNLYIWVGVSCPGCAAISYTTARKPEGPWDPLTPLWDKFPAPPTPGDWEYTFQAHPGLSESEGNGRDIYVSYTIQDPSGYVNPLYRIQFQTL
jgi:hypothetical protein